MKIIKSDRRYKMFGQGMTAIMEFNVNVRDQRDRYWAFRNRLTEVYGPSQEYVNGRWERNTEWRFLTARNKRRTRLYLRDETIVSHLLLMESVNTV